MWKGSEVKCVQETGREGRGWKGWGEITGPIVKGILGLVMSWDENSLEAVSSDLGSRSMAWASL